MQADILRGREIPGERMSAEAEGGGLRGPGTPCFASSTIIYFMMYVFNSYLASNLSQIIMFEA
jgi:hypothetical protein